MGSQKQIKMTNMNLAAILEIFECAYKNKFKSGETKKSYYCGITNDLERRAEEHNATFIVNLQMNSFEEAKIVEKALHAKGYCTGKQLGNGDEDTVYVYMYKIIPGVTKE